MKENIVTFQVAKLAKEKGYRIYCGISYWEKDGELFGTPYYEFPHDEERYTYYPRYFAPTQSLLQKWLREKNNIHISIFYDHYSKTFEYDVCEKLGESWNIEAGKTYEEALENGLIVALKLIK